MAGGVLKDGRRIAWGDIRSEFGPLADLVQEQNYERLEHGKGHVSVGRLVGHRQICPRVPAYQVRYDVYSPYQSLYGMRRGQIMHEALFDVPGFNKEVHLEYPVLGGEHHLCGILDAYEEATGTLWEVKTARMIPDDVNTHHLEQAELYGFLLQHNEDWGECPVNMIRFLYLTWDQWKTFDLPNPQMPTEAEITDWIEAYLAARGAEPQGEPVAPWGCTYCDFSAVCPVGQERARSGTTRGSKRTAPELVARGGPQE